MRNLLNSKVMVILVALTVVSTMVVLAQPWQKWLYNKKAVEEIGLSEDQVETLRALYVDTEKQLAQLQADLKAQKIDLQDEIKAEKPSTEKVMKLVEEGGKIQTEIKKIRLQRLLKSRDVLQPEQQEKAKQLMKKAWQKRREGARGSEWCPFWGEGPRRPAKAERGPRSPRWELHQPGKQVRQAPEWGRKMGPMPERFGEDRPVEAEQFQPGPHMD